MVRPLAIAGRMTPFRNMSAVAVPSSLAIPTCGHCGNQWIDPKTAEALDEALQDAYAEALHQRLEAALATITSAEVTQRRLEQVLGLSLGYLSRVRAKRGDASAQLVSTLVLIAEDPKRRLSALDRAWQPTVTVV